MSYYIDIQNASDDPLPVDEAFITQLATMAMNDERLEAELTIRIVNPQEMLQLNSSYRQQHKTTNVLAFPASIPDEVQLECPFIGDVIICSEVLVEESKTLNKSLEEHWALIVIHGVLHLLGYDHIDDEDALIMQGKEIKLLSKLNYSNPYDTEDYHFE